MYLQQIYPTGGVPNLNVSAEKQELKILKRLRSGLQTFKGSPSPLSETFRYKRFLYIFPQKQWIFNKKEAQRKKCTLDLFSPVFPLNHFISLNCEFDLCPRMALSLWSMYENVTMSQCQLHCHNVWWWIVTMSRSSKVLTRLKVSVFGQLLSTIFNNSTDFERSPISSFPFSNHHILRNCPFLLVWLGWLLNFNFAKFDPICK